MKTLATGGCSKAVAPLGEAQEERRSRMVEIEEYFQNQADRFVENRMRALLAGFADPVAIYTTSHVAVLTGAVQMRAVIERYRAQIAAAGICAIRTEVLSQTADGDRISARVDWRHLRQDQAQIGLSRTRCFCRRGSEGQLLVEMIEYMEAAFPLVLARMMNRNFPEALRLRN